MNKSLRRLPQADMEGYFSYIHYAVFPWDNVYFHRLPDMPI